MQDKLLELWQSFQTQHGTPSNLRKIAPTDPLTRKELLDAIQYPLDFSGDEVEITAENIQDPEIKTFLAKEKVKISLDIEKINQLKDLIESEKFFEQPKNSFLTDLIDKLPLYALPLYITQRIHNNYLNDLLLIWSSHDGKDFRVFEYAYILDENGQFSIPFRVLNLQAFAPRFLYLDTWKLNMTEVTHLLKNCGDRGLFYISTLGRYEQPRKDLGSLLIERSKVVAKIPYGGRAALLHVGMTTYEILNMVAYRANAAKLLFRIGSVLEEEIETGINNRMRIGTVGYPGIKSVLAEPDYEQTDWAFSTHDKLHNQFLCNMPPFFVRITRLMVQVLRKTFQYQSSKEIWALSELNFATFSEEPEIQRAVDRIIAAKSPSSKQVAQFLNYLLLTSDQVNLFYYEESGAKPTPTTFFILLHMIENKQQWLELGLDPDDLEGYFAETYKAIKDYYEDIKDDNLALCFVKFKVISEVIASKQNKILSQFFKTASSENEKSKDLEVDEFLAMIKKNREGLVENLKFDKGTEVYGDDMIYLSYEGNKFGAHLFYTRLKIEEVGFESYFQDMKLGESTEEKAPSLGQSNSNEN